MQYIFFYIFLLNIGILKCDVQQCGATDHYFKRLLAIILELGQVEQEDDKLYLSLQMKFDEGDWKLLKESATSRNILSDEIYTRTLGCLEDATYNPTDIHFYLSEYKIHITRALGVLGLVGILLWLWYHVSRRHFVITVFIMLYLWEVFITYKKAEHRELDRYLWDVRFCRFKFWSRECEVAPPDPLKHMSFLKIAIRMFTTFISEPIHGVTDSLKFPLNQYAYALTIATFHILFIFILIVTIFNYVLNIPFQFSMFSGLISFIFKQKKRKLRTENNNTNTNNDNVGRPTLIARRHSNRS